MSLLPYTTPALADYRPWTADTTSFNRFVDQPRKMTEDASGIVTVADPMLDSIEEELVTDEEMTEPLAENVQEEEVLGAINEIAVVVPTVDHLEPLEPRAPAKPERLHVPKGSMDKYFTQLSLIEDGTDRVARALVRRFDDRKRWDHQRCPHSNARPFWRFWTRILGCQSR